MQESCFGGIPVSVRFAFARLGSAPLGSGRSKNQAEIIFIRRYGMAVCWNGSLHRGEIFKPCWNYLNFYRRRGDGGEGWGWLPFLPTTPLPADVQVVPASFRDCATVLDTISIHGRAVFSDTYNLCLILRAHRADLSRVVQKQIGRKRKPKSRQKRTSLAWALWQLKRWLCQSWDPVIATSFVVAVSSIKKCLGEK